MAGSGRALRSGVTSLGLALFAGSIVGCLSSSSPLEDAGRDATSGHDATTDAPVVHDAVRPVDALVDTPTETAPPPGHDALADSPAEAVVDSGPPDATSDSPATDAAGDSATDARSEATAETGPDTGADAPGDTADVSVDAPPADAPPADAPPVDAPPVDAPPADAPPVDAPPADAPPVDAPPVDAPPDTAIDSPTDAPADTPPEAGPATIHRTGQSIDVATATGITVRTFDITVPTSCDASSLVPIVFIFHGDGAQGSSMYGAGFPIEAAAATAGGQAVFVYPNGTDRNRDPSGAWHAWDVYHDPGSYPYPYVPGVPVPPVPYPVDASSSSSAGEPSGNVDVDFFDTMLTSFAATYPCIDTTRVFLTGMSAGGYYANQLARWRSGVVTGNAPQSGGAPFGNVDGCYALDGGQKDASDWAPPNYCVASTGPVATLIIHGTSDWQVNFCNALETQSYWELTNACDGAENNCTPHADSCTTSNLADPSTAPTQASGLNSACEEAEGCGAPVVLCQVTGMGHQIWSQAPMVIWSFFASL